MKYTWVAILLMLTGCAAAANEWTFIGKTANGASVFTTNADNLGDGSLRVFLKAEQEMLRKPEGLLAMFKKPEKYIEKSDPFSLLIHCKRRSVREYQAGVFGKEFYIPWEPITPGSFGSVAFNAFCKK
jgi:hypothetical protein